MICRTKVKIRNHNEVKSLKQCQNQNQINDYHAENTKDNMNINNEIQSKTTVVGVNQNNSGYNK